MDLTHHVRGTLSRAVVRMLQRRWIPDGTRRGWYPDRPEVLNATLFGVHATVWCWQSATAWACGWFFSIQRVAARQAVETGAIPEALLCKSSRGLLSRAAAVIFLMVRVRRKLRKIGLRGLWEFVCRHDVRRPQYVTAGVGGVDYRLS